MEILPWPDPDRAARRGLEHVRKIIDSRIDRMNRSARP
jgi:hypothetical protein